MMGDLHTAGLHPAGGGPGGSAADMLERLEASMKPVEKYAVSEGGGVQGTGGCVGGE